MNISDMDDDDPLDIIVKFQENTNNSRVILHIGQKSLKIKHKR